MNIIHSHLKGNSSDFHDSTTAYKSLVTELRKHLSLAAEPASKEAEELTRKRKKLLTEERIHLLIDPGAPILELCALAGLGIYEGVPPGAGITTCITKVSGRKCMVIAHNPNIKGGTYFPMTVKKHLRAQEIALTNKLPCLYLVDSGGAFLPLQAEVFPDRFHFGRIFYYQALMSSLGVPQIATVLGSCTAGGAYVPAMSDEAIMVKGNASIFLGGPPLVRAATGEEISSEELGGAEVHCKVSGVADHLVDDEIEAFSLVRRIVASLGPEDDRLVPRLLAEQSPEEPLYDPTEIYGIVGTSLRKTFSVLEVLARLVDGSRFDEFKKNYGESIKCGFAHIFGFRLGIIANDGILFSESALKATHFIQLCNQRHTPLLFLQNIVGFMVGKEYEHQGIAKHGAKMVTAVATSSVPKFTMIIGGSYGAGNYAMCGRAYDPQFLFTWPNARISVMGAAQAAGVLSDVNLSAKQRHGRQVSPKQSEKLRQEIVEKYEREGSPYYATARLWDDGVIDPVETRKTLALALASTAYDPRQPSGRFGIFRM